MGGKNTDSTHRKEHIAGKAKGKDNLIVNVVIVAALILIFWALIETVYTGTFSVMTYLFWGFIALLGLYATVKMIGELLKQAEKPKKIDVRDQKAVCYNGHVVSIFYRPEGYDASVWPEKCPICGSPWTDPGIK